MNNFIVAEISKNWHNGRPDVNGLLSELFEDVIEFNRKRGYRLHSFNIHRLICEPGRMNETIIAVFEIEQQL